MKRMALVPLGALALAGASYAVAQNVEGLDIQAVLARGKAGEGDAQALADEVLRRSEALREEAKSTAEAGQRNMTASLPRLGGGPAGLVDFDALVKTAADAGADHGRAPQLIVFASLAMPPQSLKALIRDTARAGGSVVFNGFPGNSMKAFQEGILKVVDNRDDYGSIGIDPRLFRAFHVSAVPAVVVVTSDFDLCDGLECTTQPPPFDRISGNVTLDYALDTIAAGDGPGAPIAAQALGRLRKGGDHSQGQGS